MSNLTLQPLTLVAVPDPALAPEFAAFKASLLTSSNALLASLGAKPSTEWKKGKTFNKSTAPTRTASSKLPSGGGDTLGYKWHARTSRHGADWGELRDALVVRHSEQEQEYIESCSEAKRIHVWEEGVLEVWRMSYHLPFPTTNRDFVILIYTTETTPKATTPDEVVPRSFQVVSIPFDHEDAPERKGWCRGKYVSVEQVIEEGQEVVWTMATSSDPGGVIPKAITELALPSKISEDVPSLFTWLKSKKAATGK